MKKVIKNIEQKIKDKEYFTLWNFTGRRQGMAIIIDDEIFCGMVEVRRIATLDGKTWENGIAEYVINYDVTTLMNQFNITYKRAKSLSNLISDL